MGCTEAEQKAGQAAVNGAALAQTLAELEALLENGVEYFVIVESGNDNICDYCVGRAGLVYRVDELEVGVNAPPFHPNCGCTIRAWVGEVDENVGNQEIFDAVTERRIETLHPAIRDTVRQFILAVQEIYPDIRISDAYRSIEEQNDVFARGDSTVRGGFSYHNYGLAIDICRIIDGQLSYDIDWSIIVPIAEELGFEWGGHWTEFVDQPHFQMTFGFTAALCRVPQWLFR